MIGYEERRAQLAAMHDAGAGDALRDAVRDNADVKCAQYCYGGSPRVDVAEALADLAEAGWRLVDVSPPSNQDERQEDGDA